MIALGRHRPLHTTPGMNWLSGLRSRKLRPMPSPVSIPTRSGRVIRTAKREEDGDPSFYKGAAGVIWALDYLHRVGATRVAEDFRPAMPKLMERTIADFEISFPTDYEKHGSLLRGDMGTALLAMRDGPHRASLIWCTAAQRQIMICRSGS